MSAPSFSSFAPSFSSFPDLEPGPSTRSPTPKDREADRKKRGGEKDKDRRDKKDKRKSDRHKREKEDRHERRSREHDQDRPKERSRYDDERVKAKEDARYRAGGDQESFVALERPSYFSDRKGDPLNVKYGGLHAGDIPKYHLIGRGRKILGLELAWTAVYRGRYGVEVAAAGFRRKLPALTDSSTRHLLAAAPTRRLLASSKNDAAFEEFDGFIPISSRTSEKTQEPAYRSITLSKNNVDSDATPSSSEEDESSDEGADTTTLTSLQLTLKSLEEDLAKDPSSVSTWLSLLTHTLSTIPINSKNASRARAEITLSVLTRAFSAHPSNASSKKLRLKYLKAGEEIWDSSKLRNEWEDALKVGGTELWMEWLDWRVRLAQNGIDGILEDANRVMAAFSGRADDELAKLRVFWRVAVAFRDAGFTERATALFQAQAELTFRRPAALLRTPFAEQLDALEEFWESEAPRIGEPGATGWAAWHASGRPEQGPPPQSQRARAPPTNYADPFSQWAAEEAAADRSQLLPSRSSDDDEDIDPYATILFSDIRPLLVDLRSPHARETFRLIWLAFLGLHLPGFSASLSATPDECTDDRWAYKHFVSPAYLSSIFPPDAAVKRITADAQAGVLIGREREYSTAFGPVKSWGYGVLSPLDGVGDSKWTTWTREDVLGVDEGLVREVFRQCRSNGADTEWDILTVAFEAAINAKNAVRISKSILATAQDSLPHWAAHARLERLRGRPDDARKVYQTILSSGPAKRSEQSVLWWDWAELEWLSGKSDAALQVVFRSAGTQGTGGIVILRAKRQLEEAIVETPSARWKEREAWIKLRALLELLTSSPTAALSFCDAHLGGLGVGTMMHESLMVGSLTMLYCHSSVLRSPTPPALLRERVEAAMELYPSNTVILGLFLEAQKGQGIWGRVRGMLGESSMEGMAKEKDMARRVAEVWVASWEKGKWVAEQERTRSGLSAAVQGERTRGSAVLWRLYLEFEIRAGQLERAKKLLFRAIGECPLVKELYLLAFGPLRAVFTARELNEWGETMAERGLRMRKGLDEALEGYAEPSAPRGEDSVDVGEEEIEHNAEEAVLR